MTTAAVEVTVTDTMIADTEEAAVTTTRAPIAIVTIAMLTAVVIVVAIVAATATLTEIVVEAATAVGTIVHREARHQKQPTAPRVSRILRVNTKNVDATIKVKRIGRIT